MNIFSSHYVKSIVKIHVQYLINILKSVKSISVFSDIIWNHIKIIALYYCELYLDNIYEENTYSFSTLKYKY